MKVPFTKYSCQGNDFVLLDLFQSMRTKNEITSEVFVSAICDRKKGVGADGVLIMERSNKADFRMIYFNADGKEVEMCGNGSRAMVAHYLENHHPKKDAEVSFETLNGLYKGSQTKERIVKVEMTELGEIQDDVVKDFEQAFLAKKSFFLKVGVPHTIFEVSDIDSVPIDEWGQLVRNDSRFKQGTNVNFFQVLDDTSLAMRTFERGVEAETSACGTGATAVAEVFRKYYKDTAQVNIRLQGGVVILEKDTKGRRFLCADVSRVFEGVYFSKGLSLE